MPFTRLTQSLIVSHRRHLLRNPSRVFIAKAEGIEYVDLRPRFVEGGGVVWLEVDIAVRSQSEIGVVFGLCGRECRRRGWSGVRDNVIGTDTYAPCSGPDRKDRSCIVSIVKTQLSVHIVTERYAQGFSRLRDGRSRRSPCPTEVCGQRVECSWGHNINGVPVGNQRLRPLWLAQDIQPHIWPST